MSANQATRDNLQALLDVRGDGATLCQRCGCCEEIWRDCEGCGGTGEDLDAFHFCDFCEGQGGWMACDCNGEGAHAKKLWSLGSEVKMSSDRTLIPLDATPLEHLDATWRSLTGYGFSSLDAPLALQWSDSLPWDVIARTLREEWRVRAYTARPGAKRMFYLSEFNAALRRALRRHQALNAGRQLE